MAYTAGSVNIPVKFDLDEASIAAIDKVLSRLRGGVSVGADTASVVGSPHAAPPGSVAASQQPIYVSGGVGSTMTGAGGGFANPGVIASTIQARYLASEARLGAGVTGQIGSLYSSAATIGGNAGLSLETSANLMQASLNERDARNAAMMSARADKAWDAAAFAAHKIGERNVTRFERASDAADFARFKADRSAVSGYRDLYYNTINRISSEDDSREMSWAMRSFRAARSQLDAEDADEMSWAVQSFRKARTTMNRNDRTAGARTARAANPFLGAPNAMGIYMNVLFGGWEVSSAMQNSMIAGTQRLGARSAEETYQLQLAELQAVSAGPFGSTISLLMGGAQTQAALTGGVLFAQTNERMRQSRMSSDVSGIMMSAIGGSAQSQVRADLEAQLRKSSLSREQVEAAYNAQTSQAQSTLASYKREGFWNAGIASYLGGNYVHEWKMGTQAGLARGTLQAAGADRDAALKSLDASDALARAKAAEDIRRLDAQDSANVGREWRLSQRGPSRSYESSANRRARFIEEQVAESQAWIAVNPNPTQDARDAFNLGQGNRLAQFDAGLADEALARQSDTTSMMWNTAASRAGRAVRRDARVISAWNKYQAWGRANPNAALWEWQAASDAAQAEIDSGDYAQAEGIRGDRAAADTNRTQKLRAYRFGYSQSQNALAMNQTVLNNALNPYQSQATGVAQSYASQYAQLAKDIAQDGSWSLANWSMSQGLQALDDMGTQYLRASSGQQINPGAMRPDNNGAADMARAIDRAKADLVSAIQTSIAAIEAKISN